MSEIIYDKEEVLDIALDIGSLMLKSGGDIWRVEDTISRICTAYGYEFNNVFSITSLIISSVKDDCGKITTQTRRIFDNRNDLSQLEKANALSRYICKNKPPIDFVRYKIKEIYNYKKYYKLTTFIAFIVASGSLTITFGGDYVDALTSISISVVLFFMDIFFKTPKTNRVVYSVSVSTIMGFIAVILVNIGFGHHIDKIIIGDIMLVFPSLSVINSIRDMLSGDTIAGGLRLMEAILTAFSVTCGFAISLLILGG